MLLLMGETLTCRVSGAEIVSFLVAPIVLYLQWSSELACGRGSLTAGGDDCTCQVREPGVGECVCRWLE